MNTSVFLRKVAFIVFVIWLSGCSQPGLEINKVQFGKEWPFSVESGKLMCVNGAIVFEANGAKYAVNGVAKDRGYAPIEPIWLIDKDMMKMLGDNPAVVMRIDIGAVIDRGLSLCK